MPEVRKSEGGGDPRNPDVSLEAGARARELRFEKASRPEAEFRGNTGRESVWASKRESLPDEVRENVFYRDAAARVRIASEIVDATPELQISPSGKRVGETHNRNRERTKPDS